MYKEITQEIMRMLRECHTRRMLRICTLYVVRMCETGTDKCLNPYIRNLNKLTIYIQNSNSHHENVYSVGSICVWDKHGPVVLTLPLVNIIMNLVLLETQKHLAKQYIAFYE